jgi:putative transposase
MGRGRKSLVFRLDLDFVPGAAKLVWNDGGHELHLVRADQASAAAPPGPNRATIDLGEIHQAAVVTDTGAALVISGRGIRSHKRLLSKQLGEIQSKRSRCVKGSRRDRKLQAARQRRSEHARRRIRDLRHKGTAQAIAFCQERKVGQLYVGDPRGVRTKRCGRHHNQRIARWEMGKDIDYLGHKAERAGIACSTGDERGTSSRCPECGHRHKPKGRVWRCRKSGFEGARDVVGGVNMHPLAYGTKVTFPASITYRRPGPMRMAAGMDNPSPARAPGRRGSADTRRREAARPSAPVLLGTGQTAALSDPPGGSSGRRPEAGSPARRKTLPAVA